MRLEELHEDAKSEAKIKREREKLAKAHAEYEEKVISREALTSDDELPDNIVKEVKKNISKGAKDLNQNWKNALELVNRAYTVAGMKGINKSDNKITPGSPQEEQFNDFLAHAVEELKKHRGKDGDWRVSTPLKRSLADI